ncbi:hypothetical protein BpHYR1_051065 [Brachionus plicatilis]|uniref:Uncharacterized protein n=1 Tax=Brachionus plicatilis TaxID=10195 RepID=A0A3M7QV73_BRAPC|nr:hypothetical protein BpHYR1_051065 [Brachionus plicatilis]
MKIFSHIKIFQQLFDNFDSSILIQKLNSIDYLIVEKISIYISGERISLIKTLFIQFSTNSSSSYTSNIHSNRFFKSPLLIMLKATINSGKSTVPELSFRLSLRERTLK